MTRHTYETTGYQPFGRDTVPIRRCTNCGCSPTMPLAKDPCPAGLKAGRLYSDEAKERKRIRNQRDRAAERARGLALVARQQAARAT